MGEPETLPAQLYLLACDTRRERLVARSRLGMAMRAAALADLYLGGHLVDSSGKAAAGQPARDLDPVLREVLRQVTESRPRSWRHWIRKQARSTIRAVQDQLTEDRVVSVERYRFAGLVPLQRVRVRDPRMANRLTTRVTRAVRSGLPADRVDPRDGALAALAAAGELRTVFTRTQRLRDRKRIRDLETLTGPVARSLRKVIQQKRSAAGS